VRKAYKYRLFTNPLQAELLTGQLREACSLYNAALQERIEAWKTRRVSRNYYDQANQLKEIRAAGHLALANYSCCQEVLHRVQRTFQAFFARVQRGERPGFPRYKSRRRFDSITFPSYGDGIKLCGAVLRIQGVGPVKVKLHRPVDGTIKTVTVKRECGKWYACFSVEVHDTPLLPNENAVGIDVGLTSFATLGDGTTIPSCQFLGASLKKLRRAQRRVARRKRGSKRRQKAVVLLQKVHARIRNLRNDFQHKISHRLVRDYGGIVAEELNVKGLCRGFLAQRVADAAWSAFLAKLAYKAESAGRSFVQVPPHGTSQTVICGEKVPKGLGERWHRCFSCGLSAPRDVVSAQLILRLGLSLQSVTQPAAASVL
jgi:putative transposase